MNINVILDTHIKIDPHDFPNEVIENIKFLLTISNPAKNRAEKEMLWGAKSLPETIELWKELSPPELVLPRGHWDTISQFAHDYNLDLNWIDKTSFSEETIFNNDVISLRDYQLKAADRLLEHCGGIYKSSTGSGKSRVMLALARACQQKTIIICEKADIQDQWIKFAEELGFKNIGKIGHGIWEDEENLVIALRQSLWIKANTKMIDSTWFSQFGTVIIDEAHHCQSETMFDLIQRFPARYRFGCSATPDSDPNLFPIISAAIGPVVHSTLIKEIGKHLVIPSVKVIKTDFKFDYRPTLRLKNGRVERNNYSELVKALENDWTRNHLISRIASEEALCGHNVLVLSKRKKHLDYLIDYSLKYGYYLSKSEGDYIKIYKLTGDNSNDYDTIKNEIDQSLVGTVLFSTLAEEGTDIPILDVLLLTYPGRKLRGYEQAIGRIMRTHPKKKDAIVYDFRDANVSLLNSQFRARCQGIYHKNGYEVDG